MSASPEFYKPSTPPAFSPCGSPLLADAWEEDEEEGYYCRTPTGAAIKEPATCPPAPRKPRPPPGACRKRLSDVQVLSLHLDDLQRLFRPQCDKRRRSPDKSARASDLASLEQQA